MEKPNKLLHSIIAHQNLAVAHLTLKITILLNKQVSAVVKGQGTNCVWQQGE
jgi:hypothetical protein